MKGEPRLPDHDAPRAVTPTGTIKLRGGVLCDQSRRSGLVARPQVSGGAEDQPQLSRHFRQPQSPHRESPVPPSYPNGAQPSLLPVRQQLRLRVLARLAPPSAREAPSK